MCIRDRINAFIPAFDKEIKFKITYMKDLGTYAAWKATKTTGPVSYTHLHAHWVRPMPKNCYKKEDFPFYNEAMWDYTLQTSFASWYLSLIHI